MSTIRDSPPSRLDPDVQHHVGMEAAVVFDVTDAHQRHLPPTMSGQDHVPALFVRWVDEIVAYAVDRIAGKGGYLRRVKTRFLISTVMVSAETLPAAGGERRKSCAAPRD